MIGNYVIKVTKKRLALVSIMLVFVMLLNAAFTAACSCGNDNNFVETIMQDNSLTDMPQDSVSGTDTVSGADTVSESDTISYTDISETDISETDASESTQVSESDAVADDTSKTTSTTKVSSTQNQSSSSADDGLNAKGVYKPNYETPYYIVVYIGSQSVVVYGKDDDGYYNKIINAFTCSTGIRGSDTRTGLYTIWRKFRWRALVGGVYGQYNSSISRDYLFHSVPYLRQSVDALDNKEYDKLGTPASHGCIRLCVRDAKWIYDNCAIDTQVYITKDSGPKGSGVPKRNTDPAYDGWDPTDKWTKHNPYFYAPSTAATTTTTAATTSTTTVTSESAETSASTTETTTTTVETTTTTTTVTTTAAAATTETTAAESGSEE